MSHVDSFIRSEYTFLNELNHGSCAIVHRAIHKATSKEVAIKIIKKRTIIAKEMSLKILENEESIHDYLHCNASNGIYSENVIKYYGHYPTEHQDYYIMELLDGYDLLREVHERFHNMNRIPIEFAEKKNIVLQIIQGLKFLHGLGIYHGDLKPENIVSTKSGRVVIVDFGCAIRKDTNECLAKDLFRKGTPGFSPPEIIDISVLDRIVMLDKIDVWALGCVFYYVFEGKLPFRDENYNDARFTEYICGLMYDKKASSNVLRICEHVFVSEQVDRYSLEEFENEILKLECN